MPPEKQRKTFLSYSRDNKNFALKLARELKAEGFYVWLDQLDIPTGSRWDVEVEKALEECGIFMIIMTPASIESENVRDEIGYAIDNGKQFLPVLLENCTVPLRLRRFQYVDFTNKSFDEGVESAKELLRSLLGQTSTPRKESPAHPQAGSPAREYATSGGTQAKSQPTRAAQPGSTSKGCVIGLAVIGLVVVVLFAAAALLLINLPWQPGEDPTFQVPVTEAPAGDNLPTEVPFVDSPATEPPTSEIGSPETPIKILFVPSVDANVITTGGQIMADALNRATGLTFEVIVPTSYAATIEEACVSPADTMVFLPSLGYAIASQSCGLNVAFKAVRFDYPVFWTEYIVARDSRFQTLADLEGATWGYGDQRSTSGYVVPIAELALAGITSGVQVVTGGTPQTVMAVYNGEVDFGTVFYTVPLNPEGEWAFTYDDYAAGKVAPDMYEVPSRVIPNCAPDSRDIKLLCNGWRILDARANILAEAPDVVQKVRILAVSQAIPNDAISFSSEFPAAVRAQIETALVDFSQSEAWWTSIGSDDFYGWSGIVPAADSEYDIVRAMVEVTGYQITP